MNDGNLVIDGTQFEMKLFVNELHRNWIKCGAELNGMELKLKKI